MKILISVCARKGSKGLPSKNIRPFLGKPLIVHTIEQALAWPGKTRVVFSSDSEEMGEIARKAGAEVPFLRPAHLANDTIGKMPVLIHAFQESEKYFGERFDVLLDMDPTSPIRTQEDIQNGYDAFLKSGAEVCFSVTKAKKNPYFNVVERDENGKIGLVKKLAGNVYSRQQAPQVFDMNASIYFYRREFLLSNPATLWNAKIEIFEMPSESAFDIDFERDFIVTEALARHLRDSTTSR